MEPLPAAGVVTYGSVELAVVHVRRRSWKRLAAFSLTGACLVAALLSVVGLRGEQLMLVSAEVHGEKPHNVMPVIKSALSVSHGKKPTAAGSAGFSMGVLIPLYSYPTWYDKQKFEWAAMIKAANDNGVEVIAIINPANGPGGIHPNADYAKGIKILLDAGATVVGYVRTLWGTRDPNEIKNEIEVYRSSHFGLHGVFLDEVPNIYSKEYAEYDYYKMVYELVKAREWAKKHTGEEERFVILNAGSQVDRMFTTISDIIVLFDDFWDCSDCVAPSGGNCSKWDCTQWRRPNLSSTEQQYSFFDPQSREFPDHWLEEMETGNFSIMVHTCPTAKAMAEAIELAQKRHIGWVFVTNGDGAERYNHLPTYWKQEVEIIASLNDPDSDPLNNQTARVEIIADGKEEKNHSKFIEHPVIPVPASVIMSQKADKKLKNTANFTSSSSAMSR